MFRKVKDLIWQELWMIVKCSPWLNFSRILLKYFHMHICLKTLLERPLFFFVIFRNKNHESSLDVNRRLFVCRNRSSLAPPSSLHLTQVCVLTITFTWKLTFLQLTLRYLIIIALFLLFLGKNSCATLFFLALFLLILPNLECATFIR